MTDVQQAHTQQTQAESRLEESPLLVTAEDMESDSKLSRKRERELSLEPATPKAYTDSDPTLRDHREFRTPAKKNRIDLDPTEEEEDVNVHSRSISGSPPISVSPRQEIKIKVRQISRGVEDISWKNQKTSARKEDVIGTDGLPVIETQDEDITLDRDDVKPDSDDTPPKTPDELSQSISDIQSTPANNAMSMDNILVDTPKHTRRDSDVGDKGLKRKYLERGTSEGPTENGNASHSSPEPSGTLDPSDVPASPATSRLRSDSESGDKGLKRKFLERGTSQGPQGNEPLLHGPFEPLKRARDGSERDDNPRETKRPSPPPEDRPPRSSSPASKIPKPSGFMAYASTSSPFAAVKGQNIFSAKTPALSSMKPPVLSSQIEPIHSLNTTPFGMKMGETSSSTSTPPSTAIKRTGFSAFASTSSPFAPAARSKSPVLGSASKLNRNKSPTRRMNSSNTNPFASYVGSPNSFAIPITKRARAGSPTGSSRSSLERNSTVAMASSYSAWDSGTEDDREDEPTSFTEKLRASRYDEDETRSDDDQPKVVLTEQDVITGEEDEETIHQVRGKLFSLSEGKQWKERGTGLLKLNVKRDDGRGARLVMRKEAVFTLLLNVTLFPGMCCTLAQDPRYLRFSVIEDGRTTHYNLRVSNAKIAQELLDEINSNIPTA